MNEDANIPAFVRDYGAAFPVGKAGALNALEYLQWPRDQRPLVPMMVFIDRQGTIRAQYTGVDAAFFGDNQEQNIRAEIDKLLAEKAAPAAKSKRKSPPHKSAAK